MVRLTRRIVNGNADCRICNGEFMTKRGCSGRCDVRKHQLERLTRYEELLDLEPEEASHLMGALKADNRHMRDDLTQTKRRLTSMIDQEDYWRKIAQWSARSYIALDNRCHRFLERAWAAEKALAAMTAERDLLHKTVLSCIENTKVNMGAVLEERDAARAEIAAFKAIGRKYPCHICKKGDCYCSSGGSACKGFEWDRPEAHGKEVPPDEPAPAD